ncbi:hypothetical protein [Mesorhizobium sp. J18]|uniref:hypothetical protein n=1 Tax=Mesorhizobium sp. J18 TaxID=935263 RepID=UPI0011A97179|nr:hypothetical protein [Mesorhizobium sp. J18]
MAEKHVAAVQNAIKTLVAIRRELVEKLESSGQRANVWQELRDVQHTIEALIRASDDERNRT